MSCQCFVEWDGEGHAIIRCATHDAAVEMEKLLRGFRSMVKDDGALRIESRCLVTALAAEVWFASVDAALAPIDKETATLARAARSPK